MGAEVIPGPAVEAAFLDVGDVVGDQVVAQSVALVDRAPELAGLAGGSPGRRRCGCPTRRSARSSRRGRRPGCRPGASRSGRHAHDVRARADGNKEDLAVLREFHVASPVTAAADLLAAAGDALDDRPRPVPAPWCRHSGRGSGPRSRCCRRRRASDWDRADRRRSRTACVSPVAKSSLVSALPSPSASRRSLMRPGMLSATKMSPLGAVTILRGLRKPVAYSDTWKPLGARGIAPSGRLTSLGKLLADGVSNGLGRSSTVILRRTPGASVVQSPRASRPVKTVGLLAVGRCGLDRRDAVERRGHEGEEKELALGTVGHDVLSR